MFHKKSNGDSNNENTSSTPDEDECREFWEKIWDISKVHNKGDEWLSHVKSELFNLDREEDIIIFKKDLKKMLQKLPHWEAPGKDGLQ